MSAILRTIKLTKRFGNALALDNVSIAIEPGEFVAVLGPSGAGKTTLFRCITRLTEPDAGQVYIAGTPLHDMRGRKLAAARRDIGVVFQHFNLIRRRSALNNVLAGRLGSVPLWRVAMQHFTEDDIQRADAALQAVDLWPQRRQRADTLSGGQQQRVAIARALAQESRVIVADEPVASLDPEAALSILSLLRTLAEKQKLGILCTLHQPSLAHKFADCIIEMRNGRLMTDAPSRR